MPFTGSHPAAVLPLLRLPLPASALVIGSMAPDFFYYLPMDQPVHTHTANAVVTIDVVLGLVAWVLWHGLLAAPAADALPRRARARLAGLGAFGLRPRLRSAAQVGALVAALITGSATHVLWDEFTHPGRWGTHHIAWLASTHGGLTGWHWAQYGSGLFGAAVEIAWLRWWWVRHPATGAGLPAAVSGVTSRAWLLILAVGAVVGVSAALLDGGVKGAAFAGATRGGGAMLAAAVVLALGWHLRRSRPAEG